MIETENTMNITGIIAEYNPFHNGHQYQFDYIRSQLNTDYIVVVMNGDFTQRGEAAILNKYDRASMALDAGADLVLELPVLYGTGSAEFFATGGIRLMNELGCIDQICFGSEVEDSELLKMIVSIYLQEPDLYKTELNRQLKNGISFPKARTQALSYYAKASHLALPKDLFFLQQPNTVLAIEYLKALEQQHSNIKPVLITRMDSGYHSTNLGQYASATAIRKTYESEGMTEALREPLPSHVFAMLEHAYEQTAPMQTEYFYPYLQYCFWKGRRPLSEIQDISEDLSNRMLAVYRPEYTYDQLLNAILNKQYTMTRIQRSLLHILLDITKQDVKIQLESESMHYARVLGFRRESSALLRHIHSHSAIPLLQQVAVGYSQFQKDNLTAWQLLKYDIETAQLYEQVCYQTFHHKIHNEYTTGIIIR